jgi:putative secretion ATPase (PEP-CTERM system associated)
MYEQFYGLDGRPFQLTPDHRFFFESSVHCKAVSYLLYGVEQGEGFIVVTGEVGAGKTTLIRHLLATLDQRRVMAAEIVTSQLGGDDMVRMAARAFGLAGAGDKTAVLAAIEQFLIAHHRRKRRCLLLVDEAQTLSIEAVEELRMLSNLHVGERAPLQVFLIGQPQFRDKLASPQLEQLRQRVTASYHLGPMRPDETAAYVRHRLKYVRWRGDPRLNDEALGAVHVHSQGVPRRINVLMSRLLLYGALEQMHDIAAPVVDRVAEELWRETGRPGEPLAASDPLLARLEALEARCARHEQAFTGLLRAFEP